LAFQRVGGPSGEELNRLVQTLATRIGRYLERRGLITRDVESSYLVDEGGDNGALEDFVGSSITYRIAVGPHKGRKVFRLQTLPAQEEPITTEVGKVGGFSLHAGVAAGKGERKKLERLCRYVSRPALSEKRLSLTQNGDVCYELKTPYRDGTTHVILDPLDFIARLVALVPKPRVNLTRYHGVFAPNSGYREQVTPGKVARGGVGETEEEGAARGSRRSGMSWAQRLKRVFGIDIEICPHCGGGVRIIASIEDAMVIKKILDQLQIGQGGARPGRELPPSRASPQVSLLD